MRPSIISPECPAPSKHPSVFSVSGSRKLAQGASAFSNKGVKADDALDVLTKQKLAAEEARTGLAAL